jgi:mannose-1-phosphate guanylyltransferase / phosphomannomutase
MKAVVMAGGVGSRLRPLTIARPKPLIPVVNKPVLGHIVNLLHHNGFKDVVVTVQHLAEHIEDYLGDGSSFDINLQYSVEEVPLGTAGSVKHAQRHLNDTFVVISGDAVTDIDLQAVVAAHKANEALITVVLKQVNDPLDYGVVITDSNDRITRFLEKPTWSDVISDRANTGIYVLEPEVLDDLKPGTSYDFSQDVLPQLLQKGAALYGYGADGYWCDVGTMESYMEATSDVLEGQVRHIKLGQFIGGGIWASRGVEIAADANMYGPVYLGQDVKIREGATIYGPTMIGDHTIVDSRAQVERAAIWNNCYVGESAEIRGAIISSQCSVKAKSIILEGAVVGDNTQIGRGTVVHPNVKIWPGKEIDAGTTVKNSIIWGSQGRRVLFGKFGVTGVVNVDLTPEFAASLGAAFGTILPKGSVVTINRDVHRSPRMLKRAIIAGLPSTGVNVSDLGTQPLPVARYYTGNSAAVAGVHLRLSPYDERMVDIRFIDEDGLNLNDAQKRRIGQVFFREDFRRVYLDEIGHISYAPQVTERYTQGFMSFINREVIRARSFYIVVDYANSLVANVMPNIFNDLNCNVVALNANVDESRMAIQPYELQADLDRLGLIASTLDTDLGIRFDVAGERISLVDDRGKSVADTTTALAMTSLALSAFPQAVISVPVTMPDEFELVAQKSGGRILRVKTGTQPPAHDADGSPVLLAINGSGEFTFPAFQPNADGLVAAAKLLELLALQNVSLSEVIADLPVFHMAQHKVSCPWEAKGIVMRRLTQSFSNQQTDTTDGLKIRFEDSEWVLVLPDQDRPLLRIYAEAASQPRAAELIARFVGLVSDLQK